MPSDNIPPAQRCKICGKLAGRHCEGADVYHMNCIEKAMEPARKRLEALNNYLKERQNP